MANGFDRVDGDYNDFWAGRDDINAPEPMKAATASPGDGPFMAAMWPAARRPSRWSSRCRGEE